MFFPNIHFSKEIPKQAKSFKADDRRQNGSIQPFVDGCYLSTEIPVSGMPSIRNHSF